MNIRKLLFLIVIVLFVMLSLFYWFNASKKSKVSEEMVMYQNPILRIQFQYSSGWGAQSSGLIQGYPTQYKGKDGFFVINAIPKCVDLSDTVTQVLSENAMLFGEKPNIEKCIVNSRVGFFIYPEESLPSGEEHPVCFVTELLSPAFYNGQTCSVLVLFSTQEHIHSIVDTLQPYYPS